MSYDISLIDRITGKSLTMPKQKIRGGTVPAEYDERTGRLVHAPQALCDVNITYNYSPYYYEATKNDDDFAHEEDGYDNEIVYGIRGLYGKTAKASIPMLERMIAKIDLLNKDKDGNWNISERTRHHYYYQDGTKCDNPIKAILDEKTKLKTQEERYIVSEGNTNDYWEATAANAIIPLMDMLNMALANVNNPDAVWTGD